MGAKKTILKVNGQLTRMGVPERLADHEKQLAAATVRDYGARTAINGPILYFAIVAVITAIFFGSIPMVGEILIPSPSIVEKRNSEEAEALLMAYSLIAVVVIYLMAGSLIAMGISLLNGWNGKYKAAALEVVRLRASRAPAMVDYSEQLRQLRDAIDLAGVAGMRDQLSQLSELSHTTARVLVSSESIGKDLATLVSPLTRRERVASLRRGRRRPEMY